MDDRGARRKVRGAKCKAEEENEQREEKEGESEEEEANEGCNEAGCTEAPTYCHPGTSTRKFCIAHKVEGMVQIREHWAAGALVRDRESVWDGRARKSHAQTSAAWKKAREASRVVVSDAYRTRTGGAAVNTGDLSGNVAADVSPVEVQKPRAKKVQKFKAKGKAKCTAMDVDEDVEESVPGLKRQQEEDPTRYEGSPLPAGYQRPRLALARSPHSQQEPRLKQ